MSCDSTRATRQYYDRLAAEFAEVDVYWSNPYDVATWDLENELASQFLVVSEPILDLGVGFYPHIESTAGKRLVNVDLSRPSLVVARQVYHEKNRRMFYVSADALSLPFRNGAFTGIIAGGELLNHVPLASGLREIHRVLAGCGRAVLSIGMKWCLDSLYALLDSQMGNRLGYSMTREEASEFVRHPMSSTQVTWEVTPKFDLKVTLYSRRDIERALASASLRVLASRSLNLTSGIIPLPIQQDNDATAAVKRVSRGLLEVDRWLGQVPLIKWFAGNVYLVVERS